MGVGMAKYITFENDGETVNGNPEYLVNSKSGGNVLARIVWYPRWRQCGVRARAEHDLVSGLPCRYARVHAEAGNRRRFVRRWAMTALGWLVVALAAVASACLAVGAWAAVAALGVNVWEWPDQGKG